MCKRARGGTLNWAAPSLLRIHQRGSEQGRDCPLANLQSQSRPQTPLFVRPCQNGNLGLTRGEEVELLFPLFQPEAPSSYNKAKKTQNRRTRKVHPFLQRVQQEIRQHKSISHISKLFSGKSQLFSCQCFPPDACFGKSPPWPGSAVSQVLTVAG